MTAPKAVAAELATKLVELGVNLAAVKRVGVQHLEVCPFPQTRRWLRGRILDRLRDAGEGWTRFEDAIGTHDITSVVEALRVLAVEGLVEIDPAGSNAVRLPIA